MPGKKSKKSKQKNDSRTEVEEEKEEETATNTLVQSRTEVLAQSGLHQDGDGDNSACGGSSEQSAVCVGPQGEGTAKITEEEVSENEGVASGKTPKLVAINRRRGRGIEKFFWSEEMIDSLIDRWEEMTLLYDRGCEEFHDKQLKEEALKKIADEFNVSVKIIGDKIHNLRTTFVRNQEKKKSGSGRGKPLTARAVAMIARLQFLKDHIRGKKTRVSTMDDGSDENEASDTAELEDFVEEASGIIPTSDEEGDNGNSGADGFLLNDMTALGDINQDKTDESINEKDLSPEIHHVSTKRALVPNTDVKKGKTPQCKKLKFEAEEQANQVLRDLSNTVRSAFAASKARSANSLWCELLCHNLDKLAEDEENIKEFVDDVIRKIKRGKLKSAELSDIDLEPRHQQNHQYPYQQHQMNESQGFQQQTYYQSPMPSYATPVTASRTTPLYSSNMQPLNTFVSDLPLKPFSA